MGAFWSLFTNVFSKRFGSFITLGLISPSEKHITYTYVGNMCHTLRSIPNVSTLPERPHNAELRALKGFKGKIWKTIVGLQEKEINVY